MPAREVLPQHELGPHVEALEAGVATEVRQHQFAAVGAGHVITAADELQGGKAASAGAVENAEALRRAQPLGYSVGSLLAVELEEHAQFPQRADIRITGIQGRLYACIGN